MTLPERITDTHVYFLGSIYSNWTTTPFEWSGHQFKNAEAALMYAKAYAFNDVIIQKEIINCRQNPRYMKRLGREVKNYDDTIWCEGRYDIMVSILIQKFSQNHDILDVLLSHKNKTIVEASPSDRIWGIGLHWEDDSVLDESLWEGTNLLGKALMDARDHFL